MKVRVLFAASLALTLFAFGPARADDAGPLHRFVATYFYTNVRCPSCLTIERLTSETIQAAFAEQLGSGLLYWRAVNLDGKGNFHYVKDYNLYTKSVIISEEVEGREVRWENLVKVWELLRNEEKFRKYIREEIVSFMENP